MKHGMVEDDRLKILSIDDSRPAAMSGSKGSNAAKIK